MMARGAASERWDHTAARMAQFANAHSKRRFTPEEFHPYRRAAKRRPAAVVSMAQATDMVCGPRTPKDRSQHAAPGSATGSAPGSAPAAPRQRPQEPRRP